MGNEEKTSTAFMLPYLIVVYFSTFFTKEDSLNDRQDERNKRESQ